MIKIIDGLKVDTLTSPILGKLHHAHCSGVAAFPDGELLVVFYWAKKEANRNQAIFAVRKKPGETDWSAPELIIKDSWRMVGNPAIWIAPDTGKLWIFFVKSIGGWATCNPQYATSDDRGHNWSNCKKLYNFISRGIKNPPIITSKGWYVLPAYIEFRDYFSLFYISKDQGRTWIERGRVKIPDEDVPPDTGHEWGRLVLQPTVIERRDGSLIALMRAKMPLGKMYSTESFDGGWTWSDAKPYILPNPGGGFHWMRLAGGDLCVIYNHAPVLPDHKFERNPLSVAISKDDGHSWQHRRNIMEATGEHLHQRIGGYPTMTQDSNGLIHAVWTYSYRLEHEGELLGMSDIKYTSFSVDWVRSKPFFRTVWEE